MPTRVADLAAPPDRVMLDTNVLLAATDEGRPEYQDALAILNHWPAAPTDVCTSGQIFREYLAVATRPAAQNGLGLGLTAAVGNVRAIRERSTLLAEDEKVAGRLLGLLEDTGSRGRQVHDANLVATMLAHGVGTIVTINVADFARYEQYVSVIGL
jgi:predicted nucleic acid-binding protein